MKKIREGYKVSSKGIIPNEWKVVNFKKCINISNGQVDPKEEPYCNMKHIGPGNIEKFTGKILYVNTAKEDMQTSGKYLFDKKDVLYGKINPQLGKVAYPQYEGICSADMYPMRADEEYIKPLFLKYLLLSNDFFKYSVSVSMRTGMPKINREELNLYDFLLPTLQEQEKIASILSTVDEQIDNVDELIEKNKELKKGLMQQLLTKGIGHTKFKKTEIGEIPEEWEVNLLEDVFEILDSMRKPIKARDRENMKGNIPYYGASGIIDWINDYIFDEDLILLGEDGENLNSRNSDLAFKVSGKSWINNHAHVFRINNKEKYNIDFMVYYLESKDYSMYIAGSAQPKITQAQCRKFLLPIPKKKEQDKIACILLEVDKKIEEYESKKQKLEEVKRGLMQQLFGAKIRVNISL